jgi:competence protein ComEA
MSSLKGKQILVGTFLLIVTVAIFFLIHSNQSNSKDWETVLPASPPQNNKAAPDSVNKTTEKGPQQNKTAIKNVMVDIKGAVNHPGVFTINEASRVVDALKLAGGVTKDADMNQINLAQHVTDAMVIFVPKKGDTSPLPSVIGGSGGQSQTSADAQTGTDGTPVVHLNSASLTDLETLPGIGPTKAQAIFDYRTKNGSFHTLDELKNVTGIGDKSFEKIRAQLVLN